MDAVNMEEEKAGKEKNGNNSVMLKIATFIVDRRNLFFLLFGIALIFCAISSGWVKVEDQLSAFLPSTSETSRGLALMEDEFITYGSASVMVTNITYEEARKIADRLEERNDIYMLSFDDSASHYNDFSALYGITFIYPETDQRALDALADVEESLSGHDLYVSTTMGNQSAETIQKEMQTVSLLVAVIVVLVLFFTSQTYAEIPVLILTFGASAVLASGTNFLLGTISFVSDSVTIVLQLALSIDYAIIFCNRYKEEHATLGIREADIIALSKAIPEITSSSLTTVGGLIAMLFMQFGLGPDMAICLIKAIAFSLLSVFTLMPGLLMLFGPLMDKTHHKSFIPKITAVGSFDFHTRYLITPAFILLIVAAFITQNKCPYVYGYTQITTPILNEHQVAQNMIDDAFGKENMIALMVPAGDYDKEAKLMKALERREEVDHCQGLANTQAMDDYTLTDKLTAREFSELMDVDYEVAQLLYMAYAVNDENYAKLINGMSSYSVPLIDIVMFLYQEVEEGYVTLDDDLYETLSTANSQMQMARDQLQGDHYSRMLVYLNLPEEGDETFAFLDEIHAIAGEYYDKDKVVLAGNSTSEYDLKKTFDVDNTVVSVVSILAVLVVLLFTFLSAGMPVLLIMVIQGAIWINFSFPTLTRTNLFFIGYLIVSSIQMGANIDYAIVISGRYMELRKFMEKKEAIQETLNFAFPTIITSGSMMVLAGFAIGQMTSDGAICGIGQCLGRGTVVSIILVMFVLPQILMIGENIIKKTSFAVSSPIKLERGLGVVQVDGFVRGQINGVITGEVHAIVRGEVNAVVTMGQMKEVGPDNTPPDEEKNALLPDLQRKEGENDEN